jgi:hypothetical protein
MVASSAIANGDVCRARVAVEHLQRILARPLETRSATVGKPDLSP